MRSAVFEVISAGPGCNFQIIDNKESVHPWDEARHASSLVPLGHLCVFLYLYLLHTEYQNSHSVSKVRMFFGSEDFLAGPHNFRLVRITLV